MDFGEGAICGGFVGIIKEMIAPVVRFHVEKCALVVRRMDGLISCRGLSKIR